MWRTVLFMAVAACVDPAKIGVVSYILSRPGPMRRLVAYYIGGFGVSLIIGVVIVFVLDEVSIGKSSYSAGYRDRGRRTRPAGRHTARL
jgi:Sap, sulfolipid-1-addressing protein